MRLVAPLVPPWLAGLWLLVASDELWSARSAPSGTELAGGWVLLGVLAVGTLAYLAAPFLGRNLALSSVSSSLVGLGSPNATQEAFGRGVVRVVSILALYVTLAGFVALELRAAV